MHPIVPQKQEAEAPGINYYGTTQRNKNSPYKKINDLLLISA